MKGGEKWGLEPRALPIKACVQLERPEEERRPQGEDVIRTRSEIGREELSKTR